MPTDYPALPLPDAAQQGASEAAQELHGHIRHFYQRNERVLQIAAQKSVRVMWATRKAVALCARTVGHEDRLLMQTDTPGSVIGSKQQGTIDVTAYSPYGIQPFPTRHQQPAFNGQYLEAILGGYLLGNGYRLYSPALMRFVSTDALSPFGKGGINSYAYCGGDPINNTDPTGHTRFPGYHLKENTAQFLQSLKPAAGHPARNSIFAKLSDNRQARIHGYYYEIESRAAAKFRVRSSYRTGEYRHDLEITSEAISRTSDTHIFFADGKIAPGRYLLKDNIAISSFNTLTEPGSFQTLEPFMAELVSLGFEETVINLGPLGHTLTQDGIFANDSQPSISWLYNERNRKLRGEL